MSGGCDTAVTVFSASGRLLQVDYAQEAVRKGCTAIGVLGKDCVVLAVEKKSLNSFLEERTVQKICSFDSHIIMTFAGLLADAHMIIKRAQIECQSQYITLGEYVSPEYISHFVATIKQKYTQSHGRRPFGVSCLIAGFDNNGTPHLYHTEPSGVYNEWKANAIGRKYEVVREFFLHNYNDEAVSTEQGTIKLAVRGLLKVVGSKRYIELAVLKKNADLKKLVPAEIDEVVNIIDTENEAAVKEATQKDALEKEEKKQKN